MRILKLNFAFSTVDFRPKICARRSYNSNYSTQKFSLRLLSMRSENTTKCASWLYKYWKCIGGATKRQWMLQSEQVYETTLQRASPDYMVTGVLHYFGTMKIRLCLALKITPKYTFLVFRAKYKLKIITNAIFNIYTCIRKLFFHLIFSGESRQFQQCYTIMKQLILPSLETNIRYVISL